MVDFDPSDFDKEMLGLAHGQAQIARKYARYYERNENERVPPELPEAKNHPNVRQMMRERIKESSGAAVLDTLLYLEEVGGTVPFRISSNDSVFLGSKLIEALGTPEQISRWKGKEIAIALTEPGAGSDPSRIQSLAVWDEGAQQWVLNGEKIFISLAQSCDAVVVFARASDRSGMSQAIFVVEKGTPGFSVGPQLQKMGQRAWDTANILFTDCPLPLDNRLTGNMKNMLAVFNRSRPYVAAVGLAFSRAALDFTREHLLAAGESIVYTCGSRPLSALADRFIRLEAMYEAAWLTLLHTKWTEDVTGRADKIEAAMTKTSAGGAARRIIAECMAILGPEALSEDHLLEMWFRDSRVCDIYEGPGEVNRLIIARDLLRYSPAELS